jgi:hypothetical protein
LAIGFHVPTMPTLAPVRACLVRAPWYIGACCMALLALLAELSVPTRTHSPYNYLPVYLYSIF